MVTQKGENRRCNKFVVCACSTRTADTTLPHVTPQVLEFTSDLLVCITDMCPCQISPSVHQNQRGNKIFIRARSARTAHTTLPPIAPRLLAFVPDSLKGDGMTVGKGVELRT